MLAFGMKNQVAAFVQSVKNGTIPKIDPANTMFYFAGGLNDGARAEGFVRANIKSEIDTLYDLGARRFMVANLPTRIRVFAAAATRVNPGLLKVPDDVRAKHPDVRIALSQWGAFFDELIANPAQYGLTDTTNRCADRALPQAGRGVLRPRRALLLPRRPPLHRRPPRGRPEMLYRKPSRRLPSR